MFRTSTDNRSARRRNYFWPIVAALVGVAVLVGCYLALSGRISGQALVSQPGDIVITQGGGNSVCAQSTTLVIHPDGSGYSKSNGQSSCRLAPSLRHFRKGYFDRGAIVTAIAQIEGVGHIPPLTMLTFKPGPSGVTATGCAPAGDVGYITVAYEGQTSPDLSCYNGDAGATNVDPKANHIAQLVISAAGKS